MDDATGLRAEHLRNHALPPERRRLLARLDDVTVAVAVRTGVTPRAVVGLLVLALAVVGVLGIRLVVARAHGRPVPLAPGVSGPSGQGVDAAAAPSGGRAGVAVPVTAATAGVTPGPTPTATAVDVLVHVVGQVRHAGVVRLSAGARVEDAVSAAGGARPGADLAAVNLARPVVDGEQIVVPRPGEVVLPASGPASAGGPADGEAVAAVVDLNSATTEQLDSLPGVGPVLAGRILEWRREHGRFTSVDELGEVSGIGDKVLERLRTLVRV